MSLIFTLGPMLGIFTIGTPMAALYFIVINQDQTYRLAINDVIHNAMSEKEKQDHQKRLEEQNVGEGTGPAEKFWVRLGFLIVGYGVDTSWWEIVVTFRKVFMTLVSVLLQHDEYLQVIVGLFIMMLATIAHVHYTPFVEPEMDTYEFLSLFSSSCLFFFGALTKSFGEWSESYAKFASIASLIVVFGFLVYTIIFAGKIAMEKISEKKHETVELSDLSKIPLSDQEFLVRIKHNVAIRKTPAFPGMRTGSYAKKGQDLRCDNTKESQYTHTDEKTYTITFYRLSDGRGWLHNFNPANPGGGGILQVLERKSKAKQSETVSQLARHEGA